MYPTNLNTNSYKRINIIIYLAYMIIISSCGKEFQIGNPTCEKRDWDVMTCKIDGVKWQAKINCEFLGPCNPVDCQYYPKTGFLEVIGILDSPKSSVSFDNSGTKLTLGKNNISDREFIYSCSGCNPNIPRSKLDTTFNNSIYIIKIDTLNKLIEGNFEMQLTNELSQKINISNGYFKLTYRP